MCSIVDYIVYDCAGDNEVYESVPFRIILVALNRAVFWHHVLSLSMDGCFTLSWVQWLSLALRRRPFSVWQPWQFSAWQPRNRTAIWLRSIHHHFYYYHLQWIIFIFSGCINQILVAGFSNILLFRLTLLAHTTSTMLSKEDDAEPSSFRISSIQLPSASKLALFVTS